jgi:hypothetical protein
MGKTQICLHFFPRDKNQVTKGNCNFLIWGKTKNQFVTLRNNTSGIWDNIVDPFQVKIVIVDKKGVKLHLHVRVQVLTHPFHSLL